MHIFSTCRKVSLLVRGICRIYIFSSELHCNIKSKYFQAHFFSHLLRNHFIQQPSITDRYINNIAEYSHISSYYAVLYVRVSCFVVRGCGVSRRYIDVCYCDMFSVVNVYLDHLKFCIVCINSRRYVCCSECDVVSNECNEPTSCLVQPIGAHCCEVMYFWCFGFRGELGFLNCDDVCMCVVNKQFELLEFVSESVYVDLQYDEISLTFTAGPVCLCGVSSPVEVLGLFVRLS